MQQDVPCTATVFTWKIALSCYKMGSKLHSFLVWNSKTARDILLLQNVLPVHFFLSHLLHLCRLRINCCCSDLVEITFRLPEAVANQMDQVCISLIPRQPQWVQQVHREVIKNQIQSVSFLQGYVQSVTHASLFSHSYSLYYTSASHSFQFSHKHQLRRPIL